MVANDHWQDHYRSLNANLGPVQQAFDRIGWTGVDLFFVLSGFLISSLLLHEYQHTGQINAVRFLVRRGFKIYPAFYVFLSVYVVRRAWSDEIVLGQVAAEALFVQNYFPGILPHTWSLAVEEHFYLILVAGMYMMVRSGRQLRVDRAMQVIGAVVLFVLALRIVNALSAPTASVYSTRFALGTQYFSTHLRLDGLLFGVLLSYPFCFHREYVRRFAARHRRAFLFLGLMAVGLTAPWLGMRQRWLIPSNMFWLGSVGFTLLYLGWGAVLVGMLGMRDTAWNGLLARMLRWIGVHSYSAYLWHFLAISILIRSSTKLGLDRTPHVAMLVFSVLAVLLGWATARLVELPVLRLRERWFPAVLPK